MDKYDIPEQAVSLLGLTVYEKKILESITNMGKRVSTIARLTKIPRTSLLYVLKRLKARKLVRSIKQDKQVYWKSALTHILPRINNQDTVTLRGLPSLVDVLKRITDLPTNSRLSGIQPSKSIVQVVKKIPFDELMNVNAIIKKKKLIVEGIVHEGSIGDMIKEFGKEKTQEIFNGFIGRLEDYVKIPDDFANVESEIYFFNNSAYILNWKKEIGLEIHDPSMVSLLHAMFSCVKEMGIRYNQGQKMKSYTANN